VRRKITRPKKYGSIIDEMVKVLKVKNEFRHHAQTGATSCADCEFLM